MHGKLNMSASMSGPHHYFGHWDPYVPATVRVDEITGFLVYHPRPDGKPDQAQSLLSVPDDVPVHLIKDSYAWYSGKDMTDEDVLQWKIDTSVYEQMYVAEDGSTIPRLRRTDSLKVDPSVDSLFDHPGILALNGKELAIPLLLSAYRYDLTSFGVQMVRNDSTFCFTPKRLDAYRHAQHKLRIVTYHYGDRYVPDYLMPGNGIFIERHDFIQAITPMTKQCGGFVMIGRDNTVGGGIELLAVEIPFGYTLLVEPQALHGDSAMYGTYMMAMTGNHHAMGTADTVFLKDASTRLNAIVTTVPYTFQDQKYHDERVYEGTTALAQMGGVRKHNERDTMNNVSSIYSDVAAEVPLLLTSDVLSLASLHEVDKKLRKDILASVQQCKGKAAAMGWLPAITTFKDERTLGVSLPKSYGNDAK